MSAGKFLFSIDTRLRWHVLDDSTKRHHAKDDYCNKKIKWIKIWYSLEEYAKFWTHPKEGRKFWTHPKGENNFRLNRFCYCNSILSAALIAFRAFFIFRSKGRKDGSVIKGWGQTFSDTSLVQTILDPRHFFNPWAKKSPPFATHPKFFT